MKDYQIKAIEDLKTLFNEINAYNADSSSMIARLQNVKNAREANLQKQKASLLAANSAAYAMGKKYFDTIVSPICSTFLKQGLGSFQLIDNGRIEIMYFKPYSTNFIIWPSIKSTYIKDENIQMYEFIGFNTSASNGTATDIFMLSPIFEKWIESILTN